MPGSLLRDTFRGLQLSLTHFLGMTLGAGIAIPITLYTNWYFSEMFFEPTLKQGVLLGCHTVAIVIIGTWTFLGAFGKWAGARGGTRLRLLVQVAGIALVAFMGLALSMLFTFTIMHIIGNALNESEPGEKHL